MRLLVLMVGKTRNPAYQREIASYQSRLKRHLQCDVKELREEKPGRSESPAAFCRRQGGRLLREFRKYPGLRLLLDERGPKMTSPEFAVFLERALAGGHRNLVFFCGG
ncbi:MAG: 23S rRNA (pseudouridine(1915)-N(3))-methyltransferase RlmH, partial [Deltaproteobacteria bacterium]|nr:23S rRNA (pseudouridine(1915)-N(3))-methyltransferase RlmH [Deltaproteobacteria bacterium]